MRIKELAQWFEENKGLTWPGEPIAEYKNWQGDLEILLPIFVEKGVSRPPWIDDEGWRETLEAFEESDFHVFLLTIPGDIPGSERILPLLGDANPEYWDIYDNRIYLGLDDGRELVIRDWGKGVAIRVNE